MNSIVLNEIKNDYTNILKKIINKPIYDRFQQIYLSADKNKNQTVLLKSFQLSLKKIISWNDDNISVEKKYILNETQKYSYFVNLIKIIFMINIKLLSLDSVSKEFYNDINLDKFIHNLYSECARTFWNCPYLFDTNTNSIEIKKNQKEIENIINNSIDITIKMMLPINLMINSILGPKNYKNELNNILSIETIDIERISSLLNKNVVSDENPVNNDVPQINNIIEKVDNNIQPNNNINNEINEVREKVRSITERRYTSPRQSESDEKNDIHENFIKQNEDEILDIINKNNVDLTSVNRKSNSSTLRNIIKTDIKKSDRQSTARNSNSKIKSELKRDLKTTEDSNNDSSKNSLSNKNYADIYSNSDTKKSTISTVKKDEINEKAKFFNNYLNF